MTCDISSILVPIFPACSEAKVDRLVFFLKQKCVLMIISGGKGEGAAGIFQAWDMNSDQKITVDEVRIKISYY